MNHMKVNVHQVLASWAIRQSAGKNLVMGDNKISYSKPVLSSSFFFVKHAMLFASALVFESIFSFDGK